MRADEVFEQRAGSAGAALRAAFLDDVQPVAGRGPSSRGSSADGVAAVAHRARSGRAALAAVAALVVAALSAAVLALGPPEERASDVLTPAAERETAVLAAPFLGRAGSLPEPAVRSVRDVPVPFTFRSPAQVPGAPGWRYFQAGGLLDLGNQVSGMTVIAPSRTYRPERTWKGQGDLVPAPTDADGWQAWLEATGHVDVTARTDLLIGGARATRFALDLGPLPDSYSGCGGGRTCVALSPMLDPQIGPPRAGEGAQAGIDDETPELTVVELEDRAVLVLASGEPDRQEQWLPTVRAVIDTLRFA